jgi:hypothetical protein
MYRLRLYIIFIFLIFVSSCQNKSAQTPKFKVDYLQFLEEYPKGLTTHFPKKKGNKTCIFDLFVKIFTFTIYC